MLRRFAALCLLVVVPGCSSDHLSVGTEVYYIPAPKEDGSPRVTFRDGADGHIYPLTPGAKVRVVSDDGSTSPTRQVKVYGLEGGLKDTAFELPRDVLKPSP